MSVLLRVSIGAIAAGLCCLPLGALADETANRNSQGAAQPAQDQPDASNQLRRSDRATAPRGDRSQSLQPGRTIPGRQPYTANYRGAQANSGQMSVENYLANCLLKNNQAEIELGQFASQQATNPQVKQFAEELVKDHQKVVEQIQQVAGTNSAAGKGSTSLDNAARTEADRSATDNSQTPGSSGTDTASLNAANSAERTPGEGSVNQQHASTQGGAGLSQLAAIEDKINERCNQALREELQSKSGPEFDECFVGSQIAGHMHMLAALEVISQDTQGQLKQVADEAKPTVQKHLEHAKALAKQLKASGQTSATGARPSNETERQQ